MTKYKFIQEFVKYHPKSKTLEMGLELTLKDWVRLQYDTSMSQVLRDIAKIVITTYESKEGHILTGLKMIEVDKCL